jgi:hypothetical protein
MGLSFTITAGPRQGSHSQVRVPRDSWPYFTLRFETPPTWRARSPYLYLPGTGWPRYTPRHCIPLSPPPPARRAKVKVFDPTSTRVTSNCRACNTSARTTQKTPFPNNSSIVTELFISSLHRNCSSSIFACVYFSGGNYLPPFPSIKLSQFSVVMSQYFNKFDKRVARQQLCKQSNTHTGYNKVEVFSMCSALGSSQRANGLRS